MNAATILNADMATLRRWTADGWAWWLDELRGLLPPGLLARLHRDGSVVAQPDGDGFMLVERGAVRRADPAQATNAAITLPAGDCLVRDVRLPVLGRADLDRMLRFDLDRLMPFPAGTALVAVEPGRADGSGFQQVAVAALPRARAQAVIDAAAGQGITARRLAIGMPGALRFDFLPALRSGAGAAAVTPARRWWLVVALLFGLNLALLVVRDIQSLHSLEELVSAHATTATTARRMRAQLVAEDTARRDWAARRATDDPLALLSDLTRALPGSAWVQRLSWDGAQLRLTGFKRGGVDIIAPLRALPRFASVRAAGNDVATAQAVGEPFDVTAQARVAAGPRPANGGGQ